MIISFIHIILTSQTEWWLNSWYLFDDVDIFDITGILLVPVKYEKKLFESSICI